jgi:hypothetical protein
MLLKDFSYVLWLLAAIDAVFIFMGTALTFPSAGILGELGCLIFTAIALWAAIRTPIIFESLFPINPIPIFFFAMWFFAISVSIICSVRFAISFVPMAVHSPEHEMNALWEFLDRAVTMRGAIMIGVALLAIIAPMLLSVPSIRKSKSGLIKP